MSTQVTDDPGSLETVTTSAGDDYTNSKRELDVEFSVDGPTDASAECKRKVMIFSEHLMVRLFIMFLILIDVITVIVDLSLGGVQALEYLTVVLSTIFLAEVSLRMYGIGVTYFFKNWINIFDLVIIVSTFIISVVFLALTESSSGYYTKFVVLARLIRLPRLLNVIRIIVTQRRDLVKSSRLLISQNKQRYRTDDFDLDLCYITERIIAMSFPSSGIMALYRNNIAEVARFLDTKHFDHYRIYNMCSERTYDTSYFHDRVERVMIDDHNTPKLKDMVKFAQSTRDWQNAHPENVIIVHCKGGKGRTGTLICTHLVDIGTFKTAQECLDFFGEQRTDRSRGKKFQGVETPSQSRYVKYFEYVKKELNYELPQERPLKLRQVILHGVQNIGNGDGSDFRFQTFLGTDLVFECDLGTLKNCEVLTPDDQEKSVHATMLNSPVLTNDVKFRFYSSSNKVPKGYEKCAFFFWFYTSFITENRLLLQRQDLDNPHKEKTWKIFGPDFGVELLFDDVTS